MPAVFSLFRSLRHALASLILTAAFLPAQANQPVIDIAPGPGQFTFVDMKGDPSRTMTVYTYLPKDVRADSAGIVFVMHGHGKNAEGYRDAWIRHADRYGFMVVAPLFDAATWRGGAYSYGIAAGNKAIEDASRWSFSVIEHLFDAVKSATGNHSERYFIYGHSEGGQFVHRLVLFLPEARYARAVAANPGFYTMPDFTVDFPYGLGNSTASEASLKQSLGRDFVLLLGDRDTDPESKDLRRTPQAMAQGACRFERGQRYFRTAGENAAALDTPFNWQVRIVPGVAHQNSGMSGPAAAVLMEKQSEKR